MSLIDDIMIRAANSGKTIVLPEGMEERIILAADKILNTSMANIILIGDEQAIRAKALNLNANIDKAIIINPATSAKKSTYTQSLYDLRKHKGLTIEDAEKLILNDVYFATMMVKLGDADGLVSGSVHTSKETIKPGLQIIKAAPDSTIISSFFIMSVPNCEYGDNGLFLFADCGLNQDPNAEQLADIAIQTAKTAKKMFNMDPKVALLSFSTKGSAEHESIDKIKQALAIAKTKQPDLAIDGEMQVDAAIIPSVAKSKAPDSNIAGKANILIFPNLEAGNIGYKLVERLAKAQAIGPICQGFAKPINDLSRGCSVDDIVVSVAITIVQSQNLN